MTHVSIRGMAVHCALGTDRARCARTLLTDSPPQAQTFTLPGVVPPTRIRFHTLAGTNDPFAPTRMHEGLSATVRAALEDAALSTSERSAMSVFLGSSCFTIRESECTYAQALAADTNPVPPMPYIGLGVLARQVRETAGSHVPDFSFNTACSSAANALLTATRYLQAGLADHALVVGVELANLTSLAGFSSLQLMADRVAPFAAGRPGLMLGEGIGAVVLEADGDGRFRIAGGSSRVDTHSMTTTHPDGEPVAAVTRSALHSAGLEPAAIRAIKAHATGSPSNDEAEANGLHAVFPDLPPVCVLKPWIGHTLGACGVVELVLLATTLDQGYLPGAPPEPPDPALDITPLTDTTPAVPGHYLLNHLGFGGNNTVLVLEMAC